jgi:cytoskeletal protein CcmA (bactofilin family)
VANGNGRDPSANPITVIADGTKVDGSVSVGGDLRIDGTVEGPTLAASSCEIAPHGVVSVETARAEAFVVHGRLLANEVYAKRVAVMPAGQLFAHVVVAESVDVSAGGKLAAQLEIARGTSVA